MKKLLLFITVIVLSTSLEAISQALPINLLFRTGMRLGVSYEPSGAYAYQPIQDSLSSGTFDVKRVYGSCIVPAGGKVDIDIKNLDLNVSQRFFNMSFASRDLQALGLPNQSMNFQMGLSGIEAGLKKGLWFYSVQVGGSKNLEVKGFSPNAIVAGAFIRLKGLRKQDIYGLAFTFSHRSFLPVPILGFNRKLAKKWDLNLLLPVQGEIVYRASSKSKFYLQAQFASFNAPTPMGWQDKSAISYSQIKTTVLWNYKLAKRLRSVIEAGYSPYRSVSVSRIEHSEIEHTDPAPYFMMGVYVDIGKSVISSQMFGSDI